MAKPAFQISKDQLAALTAPVRRDILDRLIIRGPMAVTEIGAALGRQPTAIYHHLRQLEAVGLIETTRPVSTSSEPGRPSLQYRAVNRVMVATDASRDPANRELVVRLVRAASAQTARDFERALGSEARVATGEARNHTFFRAVIAPSPERLARINALLEELAALAMAPEPDPGPLVCLSWIAAPVQRSRRKRARPTANPPAS